LTRRAERGIHAALEVKVEAGQIVESPATAYARTRLRSVIQVSSPGAPRITAARAEF